MGKETSKTVGHKYGEDAGKVTDDSLVAAGHGVNVVAVSHAGLIHWLHVVHDIVHNELKSNVHVHLDSRT